MPWLLKTQEEVQKNYHLSFAEIKIDNFVEQPKQVIEQKPIIESKPIAEPVIKFVKTEHTNQVSNESNCSSNVYKKYDYNNSEENKQQTDLIVMKGRKWFIKIYTFIKKAIQSFDQN